MSEWAWAYFTLQRRVRLITGRTAVAQLLTEAPALIGPGIAPERAA